MNKRCDSLLVLDINGIDSFDVTKSISRGLLSSRTVEYILVKQAEFTFAKSSLVAVLLYKFFDKKGLRYIFSLHILSFLIKINGT
jgi:hypothetical protein